MAGAVMGPAVELGMHRRHDFGMAMAEQHRAVPTEIIDVAAPVDIPFPWALGMVDVEAVRLDIAGIMGDAAREQLGRAGRARRRSRRRGAVGGDEAFARGIQDDSQTHFHIFRPAKPLFEPNDYNRSRPIAYEAYFLGSARVVRHGEVTTLKIVDSRAEIGVHDRLVPIEHEPLVTYAPHAPPLQRPAGSRTACAAIARGRVLGLFEIGFSAGLGHLGAGPRSPRPARRPDP